MKYSLNDRPVDITTIEYDDGSAYVMEAYYADVPEGQDLNDDELVEISDKYQGELLVDKISALADAAEYFMDLER